VGAVAVAAAVVVLVNLTIEQLCTSRSESEIELGVSV
jgi:hypothetical protein